MSYNITKYKMTLKEESEGDVMPDISMEPLTSRHNHL